MKNLTAYILFILSLLLFSETKLQAQIPKYYFDAINLDSIIANDPNPVIFMRQVYVTSEKSNMSSCVPKAFKRRHHTRLIRNFKKAYPYAKLLSSTMADIENNIKYISDEKERERYIKYREKTFRKVYEEKIKKLTISQGLLLIKLIDRETGETSYEIIKEFRGGLLASTYQAIARIFGHNLKVDYDAEGKDKEIEILVLKYENGQL
ncbi:MAG: DUF4294 domain-containing protein [Bacteroidota bacterium]|nr:DUF4294 domain-containing protein [Bacteroidota bacterium]